MPKTQISFIKAFFDRVKNRYRLLIGVAVAIAFFGYGSKYAADREMHELCVKDGGVKIYEKITLPRNQFDEWGMPRGKNWNGSNYPSTLDPEYKHVRTSEVLKRGDTLLGQVEMYRYVRKIRRLSDGKLLAESVTYGRSGGDPLIYRILGGHPSSKLCPVPTTSLISTVFIQGKNHVDN